MSASSMFILIGLLVLVEKIVAPPPPISLVGDYYGLKYGETIALEKRRGGKTEPESPPNFYHGNNRGYYGNTNVVKNLPSARFDATAFQSTDSNIIYFYGGRKKSTGGCFQELWNYEISTKFWRCSAGPNCAKDGVPDSSWVMDGEAVFSSGEGVYDPKNVPPGLSTASVLLQGVDDVIVGFGSVNYGSRGHINAIWNYNPKAGGTGAFRLMKGSTASDSPTVKGQKKVFDKNTVPGGRIRPIIFQGKAGSSNIYLFGGKPSYDEAFGDFYVYDYVQNNFMFLEDKEEPYYGVKRVYATANWPGHRSGSAVFRGAGEKKNIVYIFGGSCGHGYLNDLWLYNISDGKHDLRFVWVGGEDHSDLQRDSIVPDHRQFHVRNYPGGSEYFSSFMIRNNSVGIFYGQKEHQHTTSRNELWAFDTKTEFFRRMYDFNKKWPFDMNEDRFFFGRSGVAIAKPFNQKIEDEKFYVFGGYNYFRTRTVDCAVDVSQVDFAALFEGFFRIFDCGSFAGSSPNVCGGHGQCLTENKCYCFKRPGHFWSGTYCMDHGIDSTNEAKNFDQDYCKELPSEGNLFAVSFALPITFGVIFYVVFAVTSLTIEFLQKDNIVSRKLREFLTGRQERPPQVEEETSAPREEEEEEDDDSTGDEEVEM